MDRTDEWQRVVDLQLETKEVHARCRRALLRADLEEGRVLGRRLAELRERFDRINIPAALRALRGRDE